MTEVYRVGVTIALANAVSPVLALISRDLLMFGGKLKDIEKGFASWKAPLVGAAAILGGGDDRRPGRYC
jgi:hypothetical protein